MGLVRAPHASWWLVAVALWTFAVVCGTHPVLATARHTDLAYDQPTHGLRTGSVRVGSGEPPLLKHARRVCADQSGDGRDTATALQSASRITRENCRPGAPPTEWDVNGAGDPTIQGFTTDLSVNVGGTVRRGGTSLMSSRLCTRARHLVREER